MNDYYPIHLNLVGKKVVVIGGGLVAERKVLGLLGTGAMVEIISPEVTNRLGQLIGEYDCISWKKKAFSETDLVGAFLVFAATNDREVNLAVIESRDSCQLVNLADDHWDSSFLVPAVVKRGRLTITVSTGGASPILAREIRQQLKDTYDERYISYLDFLHDCRSYILQHVADEAKKKQLLTAIVHPAYIESPTREKDFQKLYNRIMAT
ncbi:precorrin-2 dehydrogenase/sirohydrochlorin ferrochelatase family protein [Pseudoneobacillus sp. C159]